RGGAASFKRKRRARTRRSRYRSLSDGAAAPADPLWIGDPSTVDVDRVGEVAGYCGVEAGELFVDRRPVLFADLVVQLLEQRAHPAHHLDRRLAVAADLRGRERQVVLPAADREHQANRDLALVGPARS